jgi:hypothetical protein
VKQQVERQREQEQQEQQEGEEREGAEDSDDGLEEDPSLSGDNSDAGGPLLEAIARETEHDVQLLNAEQ